MNIDREGQSHRTAPRSTGEDNPPPAASGLEDRVPGPVPYGTAVSSRLK
jgi:hypothetical protein